MFSKPNLFLVVLSLNLTQLFAGDFGNFPLPSAGTFQENGAGLSVMEEDRSSSRRGRKRASCVEIFEVPVSSEQRPSQRRTFGHETYVPGYLREIDPQTNQPRTASVFKDLREVYEFLTGTRITDEDVRHSLLPLVGKDKRPFYFLPAPDGSAQDDATLLCHAISWAYIEVPGGGHPFYHCFPVNYIKERALFYLNLWGVDEQGISEFKTAFSTEGCNRLALSSSSGPVDIDVIRRGSDVDLVMMVNKGYILGKEGGSPRFQGSSTLTLSREFLIEFLKSFCQSNDHFSQQNPMEIE